MKAALLVGWILTTFECPGGKCLLSPPEVAGGPYCGIYCVYAAFRAFDTPIDFESLLDAKYVGSRMGSTMEELRTAVIDLGGHAVPMENLTASSLRTTEIPIILHVRRPGLNTPYAHWILFLGMEGSFARIVDPPHTVQLLELSALLSMWDGTGLVVAPHEPSTATMRIMAFSDQAIVLLLVFAGCIALRASVAKWRYAGLVAILGAPVAGALVYHCVRDEGLLVNRPAVAQVVGNHFMPALQEISAEEVRMLTGQSDVVLIDTRHPQDYAFGHLPGAINLPVYSGLVERRDILANICSSQRVVVYCQNRSCPWADVIAADLIHRGYGHVAVYRDGYAEWKKHDRHETDR